MRSVRALIFGPSDGILGSHSIAGQLLGNCCSLWLCYWDRKFSNLRGCMSWPFWSTRLYLLWWVKTVRSKQRKWFWPHEHAHQLNSSVRLQRAKYGIGLNATTPVLNTTPPYDDTNTTPVKIWFWKNTTLPHLEPHQQSPLLSRGRWHKKNFNFYKNQ